MKWPAILLIIVLLVLVVFVLFNSPPALKKYRDIQGECCSLCQSAFSQSPVGVGPQAAQCGEFTSAVPISEECRDYYQRNPWTVQQCQKLESENGR